MLLFRSQGAFSRGENELYLFTFTYSFREALARAKKKRVIAYKEFSSIRNSRGWGTVDCPERVETT